MWLRLFLSSPRGVGFPRHAIAHAERIFGHHAMRDESRDGIIRAAHLRHFQRAFVIPKPAGVGNLPSGLRIEGRAVENDFAFRARGQFVNEALGRDDGLDAKVPRARAVIKVRLRAEGFRQLGVGGTGDFLVRALPRSSGPLALLLHRPVELRGIESDALIAQRIRNEVERQAESIVKTKSLLSRIAHPALRLLFAQQRCQLFIELAQADVDGVGEALLFVANHAGHASDAFQQFGIGLAHLFGHLLRHLEKEWPLQAQHAPMAHGAANDLAQHVAASFVRWHHPVADQERRGAAVVCNDVQGSVGLRRRAICFAGKLAGKVDQRPEKVRLVDAGLCL